MGVDPSISHALACLPHPAWRHQSGERRQPCYPVPEASTASAGGSCSADDSSLVLGSQFGGQACPVCCCRARRRCFLSVSVPSELFFFFAVTVRANTAPPPRLLDGRVVVCIFFPQREGGRRRKTLLVPLPAGRRVRPDQCETSPIRALSAASTNVSRPILLRPILGLSEAQSTSLCLLGRPYGPPRSQLLPTPFSFQCPSEASS